MKQPVLKLRLVYGLLPHTPDNDYRVRHSADAYEAPKNSEGGDSLPWSTHKRRQEKSDAKMDDRGAGKRGTGLGHTCCRPFSNQRQHDELQSDQRARGGPNDYVKAVPLGEFLHDDAHSPNRWKRYANSGPASPSYASCATSSATGSV